MLYCIVVQVWKTTEEKQFKYLLVYGHFFFFYNTFLWQSISTTSPPSSQNVNLLPYLFVSGRPFNFTLRISTVDKHMVQNLLLTKQQWHWLIYHSCKRVVCKVSLCFSQTKFPDLYKCYSLNWWPLLMARVHQE